MAATCPTSAATPSLTTVGRGSARGLLLPTFGERGCCTSARSAHVTSRNSVATNPRWLGSPNAPRLCAPPLRSLHNEDSGVSNSPGDEDDELDRLLGIGRYRDVSGGFLSNRSISSSGNSNEGFTAEVSSSGTAETSEVQDTLADVLQMEVRRVRVKEELMSDLEDRKARMRAIGEEMKASLAREYELDRMRTEMGANYAMSEALQALDDVEADVQRIKMQLQADKADLAAWEARAAEDRSRGLFFKSLYSKEKEKRQPVGRSIPGYWRNQRAAAAAAAAAAADAAAGATASSSSWDPEEVAAAAERPLSAASQQVRSPLRLYLFSYLSAFLALVVVNDLATDLPPHVAQDGLYALLSTILGFVAIHERQAMGQAQDAMLQGIRRTGGEARQPGGGDVGGDRLRQRQRGHH